MDWNRLPDARPWWFSLTTSSGGQNYTVGQAFGSREYPMSGNRFYNELARWWPLISPVGDYAEEAAGFLRIFDRAAPGATTILELGSGGGHNAYYLKSKYALTLVDLSEAMLDLSRRLNPECEHLQGDMRSLALDRSFDIVFVHDAIDYMTSEHDLSAAIATAARHLTPGGVALFVPDHLEESFEPTSEVGGHDGEHGEGVRYLEWSWDPNPSDTEGIAVYSFVTRGQDGTWQAHTEQHAFGLFRQADWERLIADAGMTPQVILEETTDDRPPRVMFLGRKKDAGVRS
jgi:SAM-dependent methyltransferase